MTGGNDIQEINGTPDSDLIFLLFRARQTIYRIHEKEVAKHGVTLEQSTVLRLVNTYPKITINEICKIMIREHHTISSLIKRMVSKDLLKTERDNKRRIAISLSKKGWEICAKTITFDDSAELLSVLNDQEKKLLATYLEKIRHKALNKLVAMDVFRASSILQRSNSA